MLLSIVAMFKNESLILEEWIKHYLEQGVEHFYLIDNGSTDNYLDITNKYKCVTIVIDPHWEKGYQDIAIHKHFFGKIKSEWVILCDIDEYIYARNGYNTIAEYIKSVKKNINRVWIPWKIFGSSGFINQPKNIRQSFTKRNDAFKCDYGFGKSIERVSNIKRLAIHRSVIDGSILFMIGNVKFDGSSLHSINLLNNNPLHLNHYMHMSEYYYKTIKCVRGGGYSGHVPKYTMKTFMEREPTYNKIEDNELKLLLQNQ